MHAPRSPVIGRLVREFSTAAVLLHHSLAGRLGLGPSDLKCLDLIRERPPWTGSDLARATGLTTGAITGIIGRLEERQFIERRDDPDDGRRQQIYPVPAGVNRVQVALGPLKSDLADATADLDEQQVVVVAHFLEAAIRITRAHSARLRIPEMHS